MCFLQAVTTQLSFHDHSSVGRLESSRDKASREFARASFIAKSSVEEMATDDSAPLKNIEVQSRNTYIC